MYSHIMVYIDYPALRLITVLSGVLFSRSSEPCNNQLGNIYNSLFEPQDEFTKNDLEDKISNTIRNFENRVEVISVNVSYPELYHNSVSIQVVYLLIATDEEVTSTFTIERVR